jgi:hypothetical protein
MTQNNCFIEIKNDNDNLISTFSEEKKIKKKKILGSNKTKLFTTQKPILSTPLPPRYKIGRHNG